MQTRKLGTAGPEVSLVGLGTNNFGGRIDFEASRRVIDKTFDCGITLIDTADIYGNKGGSEEILGKVLGARRKDIVLATKFGMPMDDAGKLRGASPRYIAQALEASLRRLKTDWIDLYQLHRPDPDTPIEQTLRALDDLRKAGKIRLIGCSNLSAAPTRSRAIRRRGARTDRICHLPGRIQPARSRSRQRSRRRHAQARPRTAAVFPAGQRTLSGKYKPDAPLPAGSRLATSGRHAGGVLNARNWRVVGALAEFAAQRGRTLLELAMSWLASRPFIPSIIAGATTPEQVVQNTAATGWTLSAAELSEIDRITL